jgi:hypothetical protein
VARGPRSRRRLGPRAQRVRGPRPRGARPVCAARGLHLSGRPRPAWPATAWRSSTHDGEATRRAWGRRRWLTGAPRPMWGRKPARRRRFLMRWGYGGQRRSYDGEGGGGGELDNPRTKNGERRARATLIVDESHDGGEGWTATGFRHGRRRGFG